MKTIICTCTCSLHLVSFVVVFIYLFFSVQVVLISGETGSGKTTQVRQLIKNLHQFSLLSI